MSTFAIAAEWRSALNEAPEVGQTSAMLRISLDNETITRNEDVWSKTTNDKVRLSAYPLALWLASSWWRLRWELFPSHVGKRLPDTSWRMAHEVTSAGYGYIWPRLLIVSIGDCMFLEAAPSSRDAHASVQYLCGAKCSISFKEFDRVVDRFIGEVIERLNALDIKNTELHGLWKEVLEERNSTELSSYRRLEAMLGFEPDEGPLEILKQLQTLMGAVGREAVEELAQACVSPNPAPILSDIVSFADSQGPKGRIDLQRRKMARRYDYTVPVWKYARDMANEVREELGLDGNPVGDERLCDLFALRPDEVLEHQPNGRHKVGIAVREGANNELKLLLRKSRRDARRFELARFLGDYLMENTRERWLPETDAKTARQKLQRAFAGEFLCPIEGLREFLRDDYSDDRMDEAAEHFGVSTLAVQTQLVNNGLLEPAVLDIGYYFQSDYFDKQGAEAIL